MASLNQNIVVYEDDTFSISHSLSVLSYTQASNIASYDRTWWACSETPGGSYVLQKANEWYGSSIVFSGISDQNPPNGVIITQNTANATNGNYYGVIETSNDGNGGGKQWFMFVAGGEVTIISGWLSSGLGYAVGDELQFDSTVLPGTTQPLKIELTEANFFPASTIPPNTGDIYVDAPQGPNGPVNIIAEFSQADFEASGGPLETDTTYYWELVVGEPIFNTIWGDLNTIATQVVATGELYVSSSLFSLAGYRP